MRLIITKQWKLFTVCTKQVRSPYIEHAASGLPNPTRLEEGYDLSRLKTSRCSTRCPRMVTECLRTRSMLIKMYIFTISVYVPVYVHCIYSQSISCRRSLSLFSLLFCLTQQFYQKAWVWVICSVETSNQAKAKNLSNFTLIIVYLFVRILHFAASVFIGMVKFFLCVSFDLQKERTNERKKKERTVLQ